VCLNNYYLGRTHSFLAVFATVAVVNTHSESKYFPDSRAGFAVDLDDMVCSGVGSFCLAGVNPKDRLM